MEKKQNKAKAGGQGSPAKAPQKEAKKHKISTHAEAEAFAKTIKCPKGDKIAYVSPCGYLFHEGSKSAADYHANKKGLELFTVKL